MTHFVLDCSMTMAWLFEDEAAPHVADVLASLEIQDAVVPCIWPIEVANVLTVCERKGRVSVAEVASFLEMLKSLPVVIDDQAPRRAFGDILALARTHQLTAYDAAYLELALRSGCPLASLDDALNRAATRLGIALFEG
jgi:predicted nucleic acid-binding protein